MLELGVKDPLQHIVIVRRRKPVGESDEEVRFAGTEVPLDDLGTILVSREPFKQADLDIIDKTCQQLQFDVMQSPRSSLDPSLKALASGVGSEQLINNYPIRIDPTRDNNPFFYYMVRPKNIFSKPVAHLGEEDDIYAEAQPILAELLLVVSFLTALVIVVPLMVKGGKFDFRNNIPSLVYFAAIGLGFMFIEMAQLERLIIFLGHPTYSLTVVLSTLLLSAGAGSYCSGFWASERKSAIYVLFGLVAILVLEAIVTPPLLQQFEAASAPERISVAALLLVSIGFPMGMAFPIGMKTAAQKCAALTPWLWGINGAMSVCTSILAIVVAIVFGIAASYWSGVAAYAVALCSFVFIDRGASGGDI